MLHKEKAPFRKIKVSFWDDEQISEDLTPEDRYFYMYLMSSPFSSQLGVYTITRKQIANHLGYGVDIAENLIKRFEEYHKLIKYNRDTKEIALLKWTKHNWNVGGVPVWDLVRKEIDAVKDKTLIDLLIATAPKTWLYDQIVAYLRPDAIANAQSESQNAIANSQNAQNENVGKPHNSGLDEGKCDAIDDSYPKNKEIRNKKKEKDIKDMRNSNELLESQFNSFWNLYNKKKDKKKAFTAFKIQVKKYGFDTIMNGVQAYLQECAIKGTDKQYIKHATTFLNGECFNDEYETAPGSNKPTKQPNQPRRNFLEEDDEE